MLEFDAVTGKLDIIGYSATNADLAEFSERGKMNAYMEQAVLCSDIEDRDRQYVQEYMQTRGRSPKDVQLLQEFIPRANVEILSQGILEDTRIEDNFSRPEGDFAQYLKKKYKPVALKVKPVYSDLPEKFRIKRDIKGNPLADMPALNPISPEFTPTGRYNEERREQFQELHQDFLTEEEMKLLHQLMMNQNGAFAWDKSEKGRFREDFFPPVDIPVIEHKPWVLKNIPVPPGMYKELCEIV